jgi:hypothetical protein
MLDAIQVSGSRDAVRLPLWHYLPLAAILLLVDLGTTAWCNIVNFDYSRFLPAAVCSLPSSQLLQVWHVWHYATIM